MREEKIASFYQTHDVILPPDFSYRIFLLRKEKFWFRVWQFKDIAVLKEKLIEQKPISAYVSVAVYLYPDEVESKYTKHSKISDLMIRNDLVIDLDNQDIFNLRRAYNFLKKIFNEFMFVKTPHGFHIWVLDFYEKNKEEIVRFNNFEMKILEKKRKICRWLLSKKVDLDYAVSIDTRRFVRVWNSLDAKSRKICYANSNFSEFLNEFKTKSQYNAYPLKLRSDMQKCINEREWM
jgi:DNA primase catalytic subunit